MSMNAVPGFFASLFGEMLLDKDCANIEADPNADPVDKEICRSFRHFNESLGHFDFPGIEPRAGSEGDTGRPESPEDADPESLRDSILRRPDSPPREFTSPRRESPFPRHPQADRDLDDQVEADPSLLDRYLSEEDPVPSQPRSRSRSSYSSVVITMGPDGTYEERRTVRDSEGNEKVTVTYSDGQQTQTEVHRRGKDGTTTESYRRGKDGATSTTESYRRDPGKTRDGGGSPLSSLIELIWPRKS